MCQSCCCHCVLVRWHLERSHGDIGFEWIDQIEDLGGWARAQACTGVRHANGIGVCS